MIGTLKGALFALTFGLLPAAVTADVAQIQGYAQQFVGTCLQVVQTQGDRKAALTQLGFQAKVFGSTKRLDDYAILIGSRKADGLCSLSFIRVGPNGAEMLAAIDAQLAAGGFRATGQVIPTTAASAISGTGATSREIYAKGKVFITLEQSSGQNGPSSFGVLSYSN